MHCFNKISRVPIARCSGSVMSKVIQPFSKSVDKDGIPETVVTFAEVPISVYTEKADIPSSENYQLREMLKQGYVPNEVPVNNILSSMDELDGVNQTLIENFRAVVESENNNTVIE